MAEPLTAALTVWHLIVAMGSQAVALIIWISRMGERGKSNTHELRRHDTRITKLEAHDARIARVEERLIAMADALERIENRLLKRRRRQSQGS